MTAKRFDATLIDVSADGLRYEAALARQLFEEVRAMEASATYQWILEQGQNRGLDQRRLEEARHFFLHLGRLKFGEPDAGTAAAIDAIEDPRRLARLGAAILSGQSWHEVLASA